MITTSMRMGDSSQPPPSYPPYPAWAFYIGGQTPHIWSDDEVAEIPARFGLPIYTNIDAGANPQEAATVILRWLRGHAWKPGEHVAVDTETIEMPGFLAALSQLLEAEGYPLLDYESKMPEAANGVTSGGRWLADWTGTPHIRTDAVATQWASSAMLGLPWDESDILTAVRLHELNPPVTRRITLTTVEAQLPVLVQGDTGHAVALLQGALNAWLMGTGNPLTLDGHFGPRTRAALEHFQSVFGIRTEMTYTGGVTWEELFTL